MRTTVILHERLGIWARQFRPRCADWNLRLVESRSIDDLSTAVVTASCPIVVVDFRNRELAPLEDLAAARSIALDSLILALIPQAPPRLGLLTLEAGATATLPVSSPPPVVLAQVRRWVDLARSRALARGCGERFSPAPEPWERLLLEVGALSGNGKVEEKTLVPASLSPTDSVNLQEPDGRVTNQSPPIA